MGENNTISLKKILALCMCLTGEFCSWQRLDIGCTNNSLLMIRQALYGRLRAGRCITAEYAHALGCHSDVTAYLDDVTVTSRRTLATSAPVAATARCSSRTSTRSLSRVRRISTLTLTSATIVSTVCIASPCMGGVSSAVGITLKFQNSKLENVLFRVFYVS